MHPCRAWWPPELSIVRLKWLWLQDPAPWERAWANWLTDKHGRRRQLKEDKARPADLSGREGLRLMTTRGCMVCGRADTRKARPSRLPMSRLAPCGDCPSHHAHAPSVNDHAGALVVQAAML